MELRGDPGDEHELIDIGERTMWWGEENWGICMNMIYNYIFKSAYTIAE